MAIPPRSALVLVAFSDAGRRSRFADTVAAAGYRSLEALDGLHALAVATRVLPDIVLADAVLPKLDAMELRARLAATLDTREIPLLVVDADEETIADRMEHVLAARTPASQGALTLRRALADIRAAAVQGANGDDVARHLVRAADESMISVLVADDRARYIAVNDAVCALSGYSRAELLNMSIWDLSAEHTVAEGRRMWERFRVAKRADGSYRIRRQSGELVTIRFAAEADVAPGLHVSALAPPRLLDFIKN